MTHDPDFCFECTGYGDDYFVDEDGKLVSACDTCFNRPTRETDIEEDE